MAERYKRYSTKGLALRMPSVDFSFEKTRSNNLANLSRTLDSMSEMFYKNAVQTAKIEGAEYGALNAPTIKQLEDASESNTELDFVGDKTTVFGKYARTATLEATSDNLTLIAKQNIADIVLRAKENDIEPTEVAKQLDSVVSGLADVLDTESPVTARKFKASLGVYSNAEYKTYASKYITDKQKQLQAKWSLNLENSLTTVLPKIIQAGMPTKDGQTINDKDRVATTLERVQGIKEQILATRPLSMSAEAILALEKRFDDRVFEIAKDIVSDAIFNNENPETIINALENNKIDTLPIAMRSAFSVASGQEKAVLKSIANKAIDERNKREITKINLKDKKRKLKIEEIEINSSSALLQPDPEKRLSLFTNYITQMQRLDPKKANEMRDLLQENPELKYSPFTDPIVFNSISMKFNEREVSIKQYQLNQLLVTGKLSKPDFNDFTEKLRARSDEDFNRALSYARSKLNIPKSFINLGQGGNKNLQYLKTIEEAMYRERAFNPDFLPMQWVEDNFDTYVAKGKNVEEKRIKELAGDYFNLGALNKKINSTPRTINGQSNPFYQKLVDDKNEILDWNRANPQNKVSGF